MGHRSSLTRVLTMRRLSPIALLPVIAVVLVACNAGPSSSPERSTAIGASPIATGTAAPEPATVASGGPTPGAPEAPGAPGHSIECRDEETICEIHFVEDGRERAGWPMVVDGPCRELQTGSGGVAYVGCIPSDGATVHVFDPDGRPVDGWPVRIDGSIASVASHDFSLGCGLCGSAVDIGPDGAVYVAISEGSIAALHVFDPDGTPRAGWPQPIPGDPPAPNGHGGDGCRGFALAPDGTVFAWGYQDVAIGIELTAGRTEFTSWSADGRIRPGWPPGALGAASGPVLDADGGITYVSASGRVWGHDERGDVRPGWPYQLSAPAAPYMAPDGRVAIVIRVFEARDRLVMLGRDGQALSGGPIDLPADIETRCLFGDTPCVGVTRPLFGSDGTLYLSLAWSTTEHVIPDTTDMGGALVAFDPDGRVVDGWPVDLAPRTHVLDLAVDGDGRLIARGVVCDEGYFGGEGTAPTILVFAPNGELLDQQIE